VLVVDRIVVVVAVVGADVAASEPDTSEEPAAIHPDLVHSQDHDRTHGQGHGTSSAVHIPQIQVQDP